MKNWLIGALVVALVGTTAPTLSEAKRLGGSKNSGMQRDMPARTAPDTPPAKPAAPAQQPGTPAQQAAPAAAGTAAAAGAAATAKRSWLGPIAGLAAGLGLVALMSHLGLGEAFANFLMLALLAVAVIALVVFVMRRFGNRGAQAKPALAGAGAAGTAGGAQVAWPQPTPAEQPGMARTSLDSAPLGTAGPAVEPAAVAAEPAVAAAPVAKAFVPAAFDSEGFERTAKMIFIRLQAANDAADLEDLRRFTTPELFASLRLDIQDRGAAANHTDVVKVDAQVLDVTNEADRQVVSVRFQGEIVEEKGAAPAPFHEVWHLVKPHGDGGSWAIAGIEQMN